MGAKARFEPFDADQRQQSIGHKRLFKINEGQNKKCMKKGFGIDQQHATCHVVIGTTTVGVQRHNGRVGRVSRTGRLA